MLGGMRVQEWIHRMEEGAGAKFMRWGLGFFAFAMLALIYNSLCFRNFSNPEAMDAAQLGRNIAQGKGYTTYCVRPLSMALTMEHRADKSPLLKEGHRDISNAPLYPLVLAALSLITPQPSDLVAAKSFGTYWPNMFIVVLNQVLLGVGALLVFRLARRWFDRSVAWMSATLFLLTELYWRFTMSGLSTLLLIDLILWIVLLLSRFEERSRGNGSAAKLFVNAIGIGALTGLAMLTRYSLGWLILPVLVFTVIWSTRRRWAMTATVFAAFAVIVTPWMVRNVMLSGVPFGTATYALIEGTPAFAGDTLERSLTPSFAGVPGYYWQIFMSVVHKGIIGVREIIVSDFPRLGGNWLWAFFLVGLLVRFQNVNLSRMRWFVVGSILILVPVQAMARTHLAGESPEINSENLLVLFSPLILIFGVGLFFVLFESLPMPAAAIRFGALAGFVAIISLPFILTLLPPHPLTNPPPYYPPRIQQFARYTNERELWMSDVPWAIAWYGQRQCVWLTTKRSEFIEINDHEKTMNGLFISARTTDSKFISNWYAGGNQDWGGFLLAAFVRREIPNGFPLKFAPEGWFVNGELLLTDRERWAGPVKLSESSKKD